MCLITPRRLEVEDGPSPRRFTREPRQRRSSFVKPLRDSGLSFRTYSDDSRRSYGSRSDYMLDPPPRYEYEEHYAPQQMAMIPAPPLALPGPPPLALPGPPPPPPPPPVPPQQQYIQPPPMGVHQDQVQPMYGQGMHEQSRYHQQPMMSHGNYANNDPGFIQLSGSGHDHYGRQGLDGGYGNGMHGRGGHQDYLEQGSYGPRARMPRNMRYGNTRGHRQGNMRFDHGGGPLYPVDNDDDSYTSGRRVYNGGPRSIASYEDLGGMNDYGGRGFRGNNMNVYR
ncbi:MAG: hypothetical protein M1836_005286 [Candelina mexicana]|nr:MAG: hypothetical protein M1836_005286 [Candelina mexicana]